MLIYRYIYTLHCLAGSLSNAGLRVTVQEPTSPQCNRFSLERYGREILQFDCVPGRSDALVASDTSNAAIRQAMKIFVQPAAGSLARHMREYKLASSALTPTPLDPHSSGLLPTRDSIQFYTSMLLGEVPLDWQDFLRIMGPLAFEADLRLRHAAADRAIYTLSSKPDEVLFLTKLPDDDSALTATCERVQQMHPHGGVLFLKLWMHQARSNPRTTPTTCSTHPPQTITG